MVGMGDVKQAERAGYAKTHELLSSEIYPDDRWQD
jgi:hypothetical protein